MNSFAMFQTLIFLNRFDLELYGPEQLILLAVGSLSH